MTVTNTKKCPKCKRVLPRAVFGLRSNGYTRSYCPDCRRKYYRKWERENRPSRDTWNTSEPGPGKADGRPCPTCGKTFWPPIANLKRGQGKYCSHECAVAARKVTTEERECEYCGALFDALASEVRRGGGRFCSPKCWYANIRGENHPLYTGGQHPSYRGYDWQEQRRKAIARDGYKCVRCGQTEMLELMRYGRGLHVHHIKPYNESRDNSLSNLMTLCASCHRTIETETIRNHD